jgi:hypothetical protein
MQRNERNIKPWLVKLHEPTRKRTHITQSCRHDDVLITNEYYSAIVQIPRKSQYQRLQRPINICS